MRTLTRRGTSLLDAGLTSVYTRTLSRYSRRGVTMIEYVLLIAIAVGLAWLLRAQLTSMFQGVLDQIRAALNAK